jgi:hypothetical protein
MLNTFINTVITFYIELRIHATLKNMLLYLYTSSLTSHHKVISALLLTVESFPSCIMLVVTVISVSSSFSSF